MGLEDGYHLLESTGRALTGGANTTFALDTTSTDPDSPSYQTRFEHDEGSKAWTAGPVIGSLAAFVIVAGACFCVRRRKSQRSHYETV